MKNQYFADERDYQKYDLLMEVVQKIGVLEKLTILTMLTKNDATPEGSRTSYEQGCRRSNLYRFLQDCLKRGDRNVIQLREYFKSCSINYQPYVDNEFFTNDGRRSYFKEIEENHLKKALVFFDPDIGLELQKFSSMKRQGLEKYLFWDEMGEVWNRTSQDSVGVVYQHLQSNVNLANKDIVYKGKMLCQKLSLPYVICVDQIELAFYVFSSCSIIFSQLLQLMPYYAGMAGLRFQVIPKSVQDLKL